jgi:cytochrome c biogenesis protein CcmG, thiol:disulfide interchange protein DsbE
MDWMATRGLPKGPPARLRSACVCMTWQMTLPDADKLDDHPAGGGHRRSAKRWILIVALVTLSVLVGVGIYVGASSSNTAVSDPLVDRTDKPAPPFALPELLQPRRSVALADFAGKPLVINFWASWCFPCQTEMPLLESAYRSDHGAVQFLGIDTDDKRSAAIRFLAREHVTYPSLFMPERGPVATSYSLIGLPITIFVSSDGALVGRHIGQLNAPTLRAALRLAFGKARPPAHAG